MASSSAVSLALLVAPNVSVLPDIVARLLIILINESWDNNGEYDAVIFPLIFFGALKSVKFGQPVLEFEPIIVFMLELLVHLLTSQLLISNDINDEQ
jgi:hypothetical protein